MLQNRLESLENAVAAGKVPPTPPSDDRSATSTTPQTSSLISPSSATGVDAPIRASKVEGTPPIRLPSDDDAKLPLLGLARCIGNLSRLHGHTTPPELRLLDYDDCEHFIESELHQGDLIYQAGSKADIDLSHRACWSYQQAFVKDVLPWFPIFSQEACVEHVSAAQGANFSPGCPSTAIALFMFALGAFAKSADSVNGDNPLEFPGLDYFTAAREIVGPQGIRHAIEVIQSQILRT